MPRFGWFARAAAHTVACLYAALVLFMVVRIYHAATSVVERTRYVRTLPSRCAATAEPCCTRA